MISYIIRRLLGFIPVLLGIALFTFVLVRVIPGGPFDTAGDRTLPPQVVANINAKYHLDWPMWKQFASYLVGDDILGEEGISRGLIRGDFGISTQYRGQPVSEIIADTFPVGAACIIQCSAGSADGHTPWHDCRSRQNSAVDYVATFSAVFFLSVPNLVLARHWSAVWPEMEALPGGRLGSETAISIRFPAQLSDLNLDYFRYAALPVFALGTSAAASIARLTRGSLLQVINQDYIRTARAKGLAERTIVVVHALKNSLIPVVTILGPLFATLVTGTFIVESIFGINGMGRHFVNSVGNRDYPILLGVTLLFSFVLIVANLVVDITYALLDPRIRYD